MKIDELIKYYRNDYAFLKLALSTQDSYNRHLKIISNKYGNRNVLKLAERELIFNYKIYL